MQKDRSATLWNAKVHVIIRTRHILVSLRSVKLSVSNGISSKGNVVVTENSMILQPFSL